eukprot:TRINITY_DN39319_c0_g1_i1.p2 TRINITY_DN39319_c0_g1~~TRINITY_DN39319_c0_g1_i1.p2  ORF type:complete len:176 (-),score=23.09 TRINITY_DN39319_c0_g1_i1:396-923(-)
MDLSGVASEKAGRKVQWDMPVTVHEGSNSDFDEEGQSGQSNGTYCSIHKGLSPVHHRSRRMELGMAVGNVARPAGGSGREGMSAAASSWQKHAFFRSYNWLRKRTKGISPGRGQEASGQLFPWLLPYDIEGLQKMAPGASSRKKCSGIWAYAWVNTMFACCAFCGLGCPKSEQRF